MSTVPVGQRAPARTPAGHLHTCQNDPTTCPSHHMSQLTCTGSHTTPRELRWGGLAASSVVPTTPPLAKETTTAAHDSCLRHVFRCCRLCTVADVAATRAIAQGQGVQSSSTCLDSGRDASPAARLLSTGAAVKVKACSCMLFAWWTTIFLGALCIIMSSRYLLSTARRLPCQIFKACWEQNGWRIL